MKLKTKDKLLNTATILFSKNGFYGTSINDVAAEVSVSKQGLLHHFPSKEKLYAAVLAQAANHLVDLITEIKTESDDAQTQLFALFEKMIRADEERLRVIILLMRELLDNRERAEQANKWFLRPFLDEIVAIVDSGQQKGDFVEHSPLAFVYHLLGATQYYVVSRPTLDKLYTREERKLHEQQHMAMLRGIIFDT